MQAQMKVVEDHEETSVSTASTHWSTQKHTDKTELEKISQSLLESVGTAAADMSIAREISAQPMARFVTNV